MRESLQVCVVWFDETSKAGRQKLYVPPVGSSLLPSLGVKKGKSLRCEVVSRPPLRPRFDQKEREGERKRVEGEKERVREVEREGGYKNKRVCKPKRGTPWSGVKLGGLPCRAVEAVGLGTKRGDSYSTSGKEDIDGRGH